MNGTNPNKRARTPTLRVYTEAMQARGAFDGGRITETKPIGFPGEGSQVDRIGPLFYWAWATSHEPAVIGMHPHQGFEIISYVLSGEIGHRDTAGNATLVGAGGLQVMQTGSGVSHEESTGTNTEFLQIWFEPDLAEAVTRPPTYSQMVEGDFPATSAHGIKTKIVVGGSSPVQLETDVVVRDLTIQVGHLHSEVVGAGRSLAALVLEGNGKVVTESGEESEIQKREFAVISATSDTVAKLSPSDTQLRLLVVEVPTQVSYPLLTTR